MKRTKTSKAWMQEHVNDPYVQRAQADGYRARAAYKLLELDEKDHLIKPGATIVDLGAAPGSWCQVAAKKAGPHGHVLALDLLPMSPIEGVHFIQGDFTEDTVLAQLQAHLNDRPVDLVMSDMAPNMSGVTVTDQARVIYLCELALDFAQNHLAPGGHFVTKVFQGSGFMEFRKSMQTLFKVVDVRKPKASRDRSAEVYLIGLHRKD